MLIIVSKGKRPMIDTDAGFFAKEAAEEPEYFEAEETPKKIKKTQTASKRIEKKRIKIE